MINRHAVTAAGMAALLAAARSSDHQQRQAPGARGFEDGRWPAWTDSMGQGIPASMRRFVSTYFSRFGLVLNADSMSELLEVHGSSRWEHHDAVRPAAAALTQAGFEVALQYTSGTVVFMAGGNGAGKSTFASGLADGTLVLDSTLSNEAPSRQNVARALAAGRRALLTFVYRDPVDAFLNGVVPRFLDPLNERPVTSRTHASTHSRAPMVLTSLVKEFGDNRAFGHIVIENRTGRPPQQRDLDWVIARGCPSARDIQDAVIEAVQAEVRAGRLPEPVAVLLNPDIR